MSINLRFQQIINEFFSGNKSAFSKKIGVAPTVIENVVGKRQGKPSYELTAKLLVAMPQISSEWLFSGDGEMEKPSYIQNEDTRKVAENENKTSQYGNENNKIPFFNLNNFDRKNLLARASLDTLSAIGVVSIPNFPKCDGAILVRDDSMYPTLQPGDIVCFNLLEKLPKNTSLSKMYLLEIEIEGKSFLTIRYISESKQGKDYIHLSGENQTHLPIDTKKSNIKGIAVITIGIKNLIQNLHQ